MRQLILTIGLVVSSSGIAQTICNDAAIEAQAVREDGYGETIIRLAAERCFNRRSPGEPHRSIEKLMPDTEDEEVRARSLVRALTFLETYANAQLQTTKNESESWKSISTGAAALRIGAYTAISSGSANEISKIANSVFNTDDWRLRSSGSQRGLAPIVGDLTIGIDTECPPTRPVDCPAYVERKHVALAVGAGERIVFYSGSGTELIHLADSRLALKEWAAYFNEAQFQWWWEVAINGHRMEKKGLCDQDSNIPGKQGFCTVPNDQIIVMHPRVALHWVDGADGTSELKGAFVIEIIGRNSWEWAEDGSMTEARGLSVVAAHTDLTDSDNWGYGLMYHHNNRFSLGVISTDSEIGAILTIDLANYIFERKEKYKDFIQNVEKPDFFKEVLFGDGESVEGESP